ncbi:MAG TPA: aminotransferase class I/II-fold pyridoxal phosphate-dependent enzyme [Vicinamibacterales bacterium]|nr:aminotransferase class I/II-fold pyridoxal phosphate-dependent enzyme [Vicinamibacterales bacterium]
MKLRDEIVNVAESPMVQIATIAEGMPGALKLCYGESDMPTPAFICRAAEAAMHNGHTFYTHTAGYRELREAIAGKIFELHQVRYDVPEIMATVGGTMAIYAAIRALVGRGDNAVIVSPAYAIFSNGVIMSGGEPRPASLARHGDRFVLDLDRIRAGIDAHTRLIIVNSPSNPTGWVITEDEQRALGEIAEEHNVVILADEVYERLIYDERTVAPSFARVVPDRDRLIVINSFSKTYNMTGWRLGWAQTSERTIKAMYKAVEFMTSNPAAMVQQAGIFALRHGESYITELREHYQQRRDQVKTALSRLPGVALPDPQGAFYAFPKFEDSTDSAAFTTALLRNTGLALAPGVGFGRDGEGYIRVCFASTEATITDALARLEKYVMSCRS